MGSSFLYDCPSRGKSAVNPHILACVASCSFRWGRETGEGHRHAARRAVHAVKKSSTFVESVNRELFFCVCCGCGWERSRALVLYVTSPCITSLLVLWERVSACMQCSAVQYCHLESVQLFSVFTTFTSAPTFLGTQ